MARRREKYALGISHTNKEKLSCIYAIENRKNGKKYVGQTVNFYRRMIAHNSHLRRGRDSRLLQADYNRFGEVNFLVFILEECEPSVLNEMECLYIKNLNTKNKGYNLTDGGDHPPSWLNKKHPSSTKIKISRAIMGTKRENSTSKYFGVHFDGTRKKWRARVSIGRKKQHIGMFFEEKEAARAVDEFTLKNNLDFPLNFGME